MMPSHKKLQLLDEGSIILFLKKVIDVEKK